MNSRLSCWSGLSALVIAGLFSSFGVQANLIVNGDFEDPLVGGNDVHRNGSELPGWSLFSTYKGTVHFDTVYDPVSEGSQAVQIEVSGDRISQRFETVVGQKYTVSFGLSAYRGQGSGSSSVGVTVGSNHAEFVGSSAGYVTHTLQFTAGSLLTELKFKNLHGILSPIIPRFPEQTQSLGRAGQCR